MATNNTVVFKDFTPANARVIIDFNKDQPVTFSYPIEWTYWKAVWKNAYPTIVSFWITITFYPFKFFFVPILFSLPFIGIYFILYPITKTVETYTYTQTGWPVIILLTIFFGYYLAIPALFTYILALDKEKLSKYVPKFGYWTMKLKGCTRYRTFNPKDIHRNKTIISIFNNVYLHYKTTGDFDRYLSKIEILEIPYTYKIESLLWPFKISKSEINDQEFRAVFHFKHKPLIGQMTVEYN